MSDWLTTECEADALPPSHHGWVQGGVISPLIVVLYVADLEDWFKCSSAKTCADDTYHWHYSDFSFSVEYFDQLFVC